MSAPTSEHEADDPRRSRRDRSSVIRRLVHRLAVAIVFSMVASCAGPTGTNDEDGDVSSAEDAGHPDVSDASRDAVSIPDAGRDAADTSDAGPSFDETIERFVRQRCERFERCFDDYTWRALHGDLDTCLERLADDLQRYSEGAPATTEEIVACGTASEETACADRLPECDFRGSLTVGEPCTFAEECETGLCWFDSFDATCGTCLEHTVDGDDCREHEFADRAFTESCTNLLACVDRTCRTRAQLDEACGELPCFFGLDCVDGTCVEGGELGDVCDPDDLSIPACDDNSGLTCDRTLGECVEVSLVEVGADCGRVDGQLTFCLGPVDCPTATPRICTPRGSEGDVCEAGNSQVPRCAYPLRCVDGTCRQRMCEDE